MWVLPKQAMSLVSTSITHYPLMPITYVGQDRDASNTFPELGMTRWPRKGVGEWSNVHSPVRLVLLLALPSGPWALGIYIHLGTVCALPFLASKSTELEPDPD